MQSNNFYSIIYENCNIQPRSPLVVHLCFGFSLWRQMAPQQSAKFRTALFGQYRTSLRKHSVANYASISTLFSLFVRAAYARDNILPVCIVLRGTMLLFLVLNYNYIECNGSVDCY